MRSRGGLVQKSAFLGLVLVAFLLGPPGSFAEERDAATEPVEKQLQAIVASLRERLAITAAVDVAIVPSNALMMSVAAPDDQSRPFLLAVDSSFLDTLTDDELEAAIAHELGHVWVFTHHPFLQTEELANQIAMRAVSRESLELVYGKVWARGGVKGDLVRFLGTAPAAGLASDNQAR